MKIALCLSGIVGGKKGKDGIGGDIDYKCCYDYYYKNIISNNDVDIFIHSWSVKHKENLNKLYLPKKSFFEPQKKFPFNKSLLFFGGKGKKNVEKYSPLINSRFYSSKEVISLKKSYEKENNFKYDFVMVSRFDLMWLIPLNFNNFNPKYFYISNWNNRNIVNDKTNRSKKSKRYLDLWFFSNSDYMDYYGNVFDELEKINITDPHRFLWHYLNKNEKIQKNIKYELYIGSDYELYRNKILGEKK